MAKKKRKKRTTAAAKKRLALKRKKMIKKISIVLIVLVLLVLCIFFYINSKKITCTKTTNTDYFKTESKVVVTLGNSGIKKIDTTKKISMIKNDDETDYVSAIKSSANNAYKNLGIDYNMKLEDKTLIINATYSDKKKYIIDNIYVEKEDVGVSFNLIEEDLYEKYATFDLSKKYNNEKVKDILKKADYTCK